MITQKQMRNMSMYEIQIISHIAAELTTVPTGGSLESKPRGRCTQDLYSESEMASDLKRLSVSPLGAISNLKSHLFPLRTLESLK